MFNKSLFEEFLISPGIPTLTYIDSHNSSNSKLYYKEKFNHRFYLLYEKDYKSNYMSDRSYEFAGYFDSVDRVLYEASSNTKDILRESTVCKCSDFDELLKQIRQDISDRLIRYALHNQIKLKNQYKEKFCNQDERTFDSYKNDVEKEFIRCSELKEIPIPNYNARYKYEHEFNFSNNLIYTDYLDQPTDTINSMCKKVLEKDEILQDLAELILKNEFENSYLQEILENKNNSFSQLFLNREILSCIKNIEAVNLNITISYNNKNLTFKFPKIDLVNRLEEVYSDADDYGKYYEVVENFLKEHKKTENNWHEDYFDFSNITSITYGKNILYEKKEQNKKYKEEIDKDITDDMF